MSRLAEEQYSRRSAITSPVSLYLAADRITDGLMSIDSDWCCLYINDAAARILHLDPQKIIGEDIRYEQSEDGGLPFLPICEEAMRKQTTIVAAEYYPINNTWYENRVFPTSSGLSILFADITKRKQAEMAQTALMTQVEYLLHHDCLTGLRNRIFYEKEKARLNVSGELPLSIIVSDINGLKLINNALGHESGDKIIEATAKIFKSCCRDTDIIGRTGSDEFSILLPFTDAKTTEQIIRKIKAACEEYNANIDNDLLHINISSGNATKTVAGISIDFVENLAEEHMCSCKLLQKKSIHSTIVSSIRSTMNDKSQETAEHSERLAVLTRKIGEKLNMTSNELNELELFATLHDIGKISIGDEILNKSGKLSPDEWTQMKRHSEIGYNLAMSASELKPIASYILSHHENWNGSGYPQGLSGEMIPLASRILAVADTYDAMTQDRVYRTAMGKEAALKEIRQNIGLKFDPAVTEVFFQIIEE